MKEEIAALLQNCGLTTGEARAYLALLRLGNSTAGPVAFASGVTISKIYQVLARLQEKGLVTVILKSKKRHYQAVPPSRLQDWLAAQEQQIVSRRQQLQVAIPQLEILSKEGRQNQAEIFTGWKGMQAAQGQMISEIKQDEFLFFYNHDETVPEQAERFFHSMNATLNKKGVVMRGLCNATYLKVYKKVHNPHVKIRFLPKDAPANINICGNNIMLISWRTPMGVLIHAPELAEDFRTLFNTLWNETK